MPERGKPLAVRALPCVMTSLNTQCQSRVYWMVRLLVERSSRRSVKWSRRDADFGQRDWLNG
jgi:hypothetical protein